MIRRFTTLGRTSKSKDIVDTVIFPKYKVSADAGPDSTTDMMHSAHRGGLSMPDFNLSMMPAHISRSTSLDDIFKKSLAWALNPGMPYQHDLHSILMDVKETPSTFELLFEVPGLKKDQLKLEIHDKTLTLTAERDVAKKEVGENWKKMERFYGSSSRSVRIPESVSNVEKDFKTHLDHGVLSVKMKKLPEEELKLNHSTGKKIEIE